MKILTIAGAVVVGAVIIVFVWLVYKLATGGWRDEAVGGGA